MIVYGPSISPFVRKVLAYAAEKGIALEHRAMAPGSDDAGFRAASPFRKTPAFTDGDFSISDSSAIVAYLEALHPDPPLIPAEAKARARTVWFDEFADTIFAAVGSRIFFNRIVAPRFLNQPGDDAVADKAEREDLPPILDYLESVVPAEGGFLVGDGITLADIAVASPFVNLGHMGIAPEPERFPRTARYVAQILARPSFASWIARERAFLARNAAA